MPAWLPDIAMRRAKVILSATFLLTVGLLAYSVANFQINTDLDAMVSSKLSSQRNLTDLERAFPQMKDTLVVVIEGQTPEQTCYARDFLADRFLARPDVFHSVFTPGGGRFFQHNGLLYLNENELADLADRLAEVQPLLGLFSREMSLKNFFGAMSEAAAESRNMTETGRFDVLLAQVAATIRNAAAGSAEWISWQALMNGDDRQEPQRELILLRPFLNETAFNPAETAFKTIQDIKQSLREVGLSDVSLRTTGKLALKIANLESVKKSIGFAAAASFIMVAALLVAGLQSIWLICLCLTVLMVGLIWTLAFAMAVIGRLNIISVTFVTLFIGLGIDYGIQYCLRYKELVLGGWDHAPAVRKTTGEVGNALLLCAITTSIGFYAFVPTAYTGASELGLISGTAVIVIFAANVTLLPALLHIRPPSFKSKDRSKGAFLSRINFLPARFPRVIVALSLAAAMGGAALIPRAYFDFNPLNLNDVGSESVQAARDLLKDPKTSLWTMSVVTDSPQEAVKVARRLEKLPTVNRAMSLSDLTPERQDEKIQTIDDMALFIPRIPDDPPIVSTSIDKTTAALISLRNALSEKTVLDRFPSATPLIQAIDQLLDQAGQGAGKPLLERLETSLLLPLKLFLMRLNRLMHPERFTVKDLPTQLRDDFASNGQYRVEVFPSENLNNLSAMERFVNDVQRVVPTATGSASGIVGAGKAISQAFLQAMFTALAAIIVFLVFSTRSGRDVSLIILPLLAGLGMTIGVTVVLGIPFNFANIIALPLLLGVGLDYSLHLVHRYRSDPASRENILGTSAARGILFSALTTIASFSSLSFSSHRGMAGMGVMLTVCIVCMIVATLVLLPALLQLFPNRRSGS